MNQGVFFGLQDFRNQREEASPGKTLQKCRFNKVQCRRQDISCNMVVLAVVGNPEDSAETGQETATSSNSNRH